MVIGWVIAAVVAVVVGAAQLMKNMQQKMKDKQAGMMLSKSGGSNPIKMIYGKRRISTDNAWKAVSRYAMPQTSGWDSAYISPRESTANTKNHSDYLHRLDVWCQGPVHSIGNYKIDKDKTGHARFSNGSKAWARILTKHGNPNQTMFSALRSNHGAITSSMKAQDLAWSWCRFYYKPDDPEFQGEPNITAEIQGLKVWDPRTHLNSPTVKAWSDNPALCLLDYLLADYGRALSVNDVDIPSFIAAANSCDTMVDLPDEPTAQESISFYDPETGTMISIPVGGFFPGYRNGQPANSRKRYTTNIVLESDNSTIDNCQELLKTMKGSLPFINGKYRLMMEEEGTSVMSFSNDNIIGGVNLGWADRSKRLNRATIKFPNENKGYQDDTVSWPAAGSALHQAYVSADNDDELHSEFELIGVTDMYQARDMAEFAVRDSRSQEYITFKTQPQAMALDVGDVITVSNDALDIVNKLYRVRETSMNADLTVTVKGQIYDATIYPWSVGDEDAEAAALNMTPSLFDQPAAMVNVAATTATRLNDDGTAHTDATVTWDELPTGTSAVECIEVGYKLNAESVYTWAILPADTESHTITGLQDVQLYNIAVRYRNTVGKFSAVVVVNIGTLTAGTNLDAAAVAAQAAADAAALEAAQALTDAAAAAAAVAALDFSSYLEADDLPDLSDYITTAEGAALQSAAETYAAGLTTNLQTAAQVTAAIEADETVIDGARITTGTIDAARVSISGINISELNNDSLYATGTEVSDAVEAIDLSDYVANADLAGYVTTAQGAALQAAAELYADGLTTNLQTAAQVSAAIEADTTVIDGARITTGTIAAGRISISGLNASDLNNDAFASPSDIPDVSDFATTAELTAAQTAAETAAAAYADLQVSGLATTAELTAAQTAAETAAAAYADLLFASAPTDTDITNAVNAVETALEAYADGLVEDLATGAELTAAQEAMETYADGLVTGLQTAAQVSAAIAADTTVIDGARITTGTINAARISLSGFNLSDLNNDGFALSTDIPDISNLQTAAQVTAAIQTDTTSIQGSRIVTGSLSAGTISGGTLDFTNVNADNLYVSSISGDINTLVPFKKQTTQTIPYLTASTSFTIFEGTIPASGSSDIKRKPYISATGWGVFENDDVYKLELFMKVNDPSPSATSLGIISSPTLSSATGYMPAMGSVQVPGQVYVQSGTVLQDQYYSYVRTLGSVWYSFYNSSTNKTTISYVRDPVSGTGPILSAANRSLKSPAPAASYQLVNEFFFRSPFDYDPYQFAINGALSDATEHAVDCQIKLRLFNQVGSGAIPYSQPNKNWTNDRIYNLSGIMMSLR